MKSELKLTPRQFEILNYVYEQGGTTVEVYPRLLKQNKNFYDRVAKLESEGLITLIRNAGYASIFTLTKEGFDLCRLNKLVKFPGIISPIEKLSVEEMEKTYNKMTNCK